VNRERLRWGKKNRRKEKTFFLAEGEKHAQEKKGWVTLLQGKVAPYCGGKDTEIPNCRRSF